MSGTRPIALCVRDNRVSLSRETPTRVVVLRPVIHARVRALGALSVSLEEVEVGRSHRHGRRVVSAIETSGFGNPLM